MSFSFSLSYLIRYQENWWASDTELSGEQSRRTISYDAALKVLNTTAHVSSGWFVGEQHWHVANGARFQCEAQNKIWVNVVHFGMNRQQFVCFVLFSVLLNPHPEQKKRENKPDTIAQVSTYAHRDGATLQLCSCPERHLPLRLPNGALHCNAAVVRHTAPEKGIEFPFFPFNGCSYWPHFRTKNCVRFYVRHTFVPPLPAWAYLFALRAATERERERGRTSTPLPA